MKKTTLILMTALLIAPMAVEAGKGKKNNGNNAGCDLNSLLAELPVESLKAEEEKNLLFMREEEKLARDTYLSLYEEWDLKIFRNIAKAEGKHMASALALIEKYALEDPAGDNALGVFSNPTLQALYEDLSALGVSSVENALLVGAAIEDVDIFDLQRSLEATDNEDLEVLYQNLMMGSRNHLRAFAKVLDRNGVTYEPVHLTPDEYDEIVNSPTEKGLVDANGELICGGSNRGRGSKADDNRSKGKGNGDCDGECDGSGGDDGRGKRNGDGECDGSGNDGGTGGDECDGSGNDDGTGKGKGKGNGQGSDGGGNGGGGS